MSVSPIIAQNSKPKRGACEANLEVDHVARCLKMLKKDFVLKDDHAYKVKTALEDPSSKVGVLKN